VLLETLNAGARSYRDLPGREPKYTKLAATWLNGECFLTMNTMVSEILSRLGIQLRNTGPATQDHLPEVQPSTEEQARPLPLGEDRPRSRGGTASIVDGRAPNLTKLLDQLTPSHLDPRETGPGGGDVGTSWRRQLRAHRW
jgi:hypothetical protein